MKTLACMRRDIRNRIELQLLDYFATLTLMAAAKSDPQQFLAQVLTRQFQAEIQGATEKGQDSGSSLAGD